MHHANPELVDQNVGGMTLEIRLRDNAEREAVCLVGTDLLIDRDLDGRAGLLGERYVVSSSDRQGSALPTRAYDREALNRKLWPM